MSVIGVDLGTSGVRAVAFANDGRVIAGESRRIALHRDRPGRVEQDPLEVLLAAEGAVRQVAVAAIDAEDAPEALAFAVLGEAILPIDASGEPRARIAVSMDTRGARSAARFGDIVGARRFTEITGQPLHGMFSLFKIAAGCDGWRDAAAYRCVGDFVMERWTGRAMIDCSGAARMGLYAVDSQDWSDELLAAASQLAPWIRRDALPTPIAGGRMAGRLTGPVAARLGLNEGLPVIAGAHDQAAGFLGAGGAPGRTSVISFGTSDCVSVGSVARPPALHGSGFATYRVDESLWVTLAGTAAGGWTLEWFAGILGRDVNEVFADLAEVPPPLLVLPYLAGLDNNPNARGQIFGLTLETSVPQLARSVVESAGFEFAKITNALRGHGITVGSLRVTGSGATNRTALAARANAAGLTLVPVLKDAPARGAAVLAARGAGIDAPGLLSAPEPIAPAQTPGAASREWYEAQRRRYGELYEFTRGIAAWPNDFTTEAKCESGENT